MVGDNDGVGSHPRQPIGIIGMDDAFDDQLPRPESADAIQIFPVEGCIIVAAHRGRCLRHIPGRGELLEVAEGGKAMPERGEDPFWVQGEIEQIARRIFERHREVVPEISLPIAADGQIHRNDQGLIFGCDGAADQLLGKIALPEDVGLQPQPAIDAFAQMLDRNGRGGRKRERDVVFLRHPGKRQIAARPDESPRRQSDRLQRAARSAGPACWSADWCWKHPPAPGEKADACPNAAALSVSVTSSSAPPSMKSKTPRGSLRAASCARS